MSNIVETDFRVVQERTLPVIASEILQIEENVGRVALDGAIRIGEKLKEAKEKVEFGKWEDWCRENLNYSKSKAEKLMKIAAEYGDENSPYAKTYTCTDLSISKALRLLQVPEDEVKEFVKENPVEDMSVKELEEKIRAEKYKNQELSGRIDVMELENDNLKRELESLKDSAEDREVEKLRDQVEKQKETVKKLKADLKGEKDKRDEAVSEALEEERKKIKEEAVSEAEAETEELRLQVNHLEQRIRKGEAAMLFKAKVDALQDTFDSCLEAMTETEDPVKMQDALKVVLENMREELEVSLDEAV